MNSNDFNKFSELWSDTHEIMAGGKVFSSRNMTMIFEDFEDYSFDVISKALKLHRKQNKFAPTSADIIEIISNYSKSKHIGAEEAWSIALQSFDERLPIVLTKEILSAKAAVQGIYDSGDSIGARMAFKEAYNRILLTANEVKWFVTQGDDKSLTESCVKQAIAMGRLPIGTEERYRLEAPTITYQALIEQAHKKTGKVDALTNLKFIKSLLVKPKDNGIAEREAERKVFEAHRTDIITKAQQKLDAELV
jgi:hypothetical protein